MININGRTFYLHKGFDVDCDNIYLDENGCGFCLDTLFVNDIIGSKGRYKKDIGHYCVILCHETGKYYNNAVECGKDLNIHPRSINNYLNNSNSADKLHGYTLSYIIARQKDEKLKYNAVDIDNIPRTSALHVFGYIPNVEETPSIHFDHTVLCEQGGLSESNIQKCLSGWRIRAGAIYMHKLTKVMSNNEFESTKTKDIPTAGTMEKGKNFVKFGNRKFYKYSRNGLYESWLDVNGAGFGDIYSLYIDDPECKIGRWNCAGHCYAVWCLNNGVIYNTIKDACEAFGLNRDSLRTKLFKNYIGELKGIRFAYIEVKRPEKDQRKHCGEFEPINDMNIEVHNISTQPAIAVQMAGSFNNQIYYDISRCADAENVRVDYIKKRCEGNPLMLNSKGVPMYYAKDYLKKEED